MKIIGHTKVPNLTYAHVSEDAYVAIVTRTELNLALEKGYSKELGELKVGDELDLGAIPLQRERIVQATQKMQDAYETFVKAAPVMTELVRILDAAQRQEATS